MLIELRHISKSYAEPERGESVPVLRDISLSIQPGAGKGQELTALTDSSDSTFASVMGLDRTY